MVCALVFHSILQDTKMKIQKMKLYQERLMESLGDILEKHVPLPQNETSTNKKNKVQRPVLCLTIVRAACLRAKPVRLPHRCR